MHTFYRQLPNQLTLLRLVLAAVFFVLLNCYRYEADSPAWLLPVAIVVFILAAITDTLDGYLARKWHVESKFGRIMDPFCDKVLVIGAFVYLAGPRFVIPGSVEIGDIDFFSMVTGVYPWMVAVILARELLVTAIRGELEGEGVKFGATSGANSR
ncbi:MAG: CDP-alcohol phosphatidyltransferase family protein [Phycisphaerales bacterium]